MPPPAYDIINRATLGPTQGNTFYFFHNSLSVEEEENPEENPTSWKSVFLKPLQCVNNDSAAIFKHFKHNTFVIL